MEWETKAKQLIIKEAFDSLGLVGWSKSSKSTCEGQACAVGLTRQTPCQQGMRLDGWESSFSHAIAAGQYEPWPELYLLWKSGKQRILAQQKIFLGLDKRYSRISLG